MSHLYTCCDLHLLHPAVVDVALGVHYTSVLTSNAPQVCALLRGQLSYESLVGAFFLFYPLEILWHLLSHSSCPPEGLWHLLLKITMLVKVTARFLMYSDHSSAKIPFLRVLFFAVWSIPPHDQYTIAAVDIERAAITITYTWEFSSGSCETSMSDASEEFYCLV